MPTFTIHSLRSQMLKSFLMIAVTLAAAFFFANPAYAATVELTVNGGSTAAITNGQSVTLEWYISGVVSSCVINNGVGPIDTSTLPATGSLTVTPPDGSTTDYTLTCTGGSSVATVAINPDVTLEFNDFWTTGERDFDSGEAKVVLEWTSRYATECSEVWIEEAANPGVVIWAESHGDSLQTTGEIDYDDDNSQYPITRDTTFYIECTNTVTGASTVESIFLSVIDPDPLPPPTANIESREPGAATTVTRDPLTGLAEVELYWNSNRETDQCAFQAYYGDGTPYPLEEPQGFDRWGAVTHQYAGTFYIDFYETTRFQLTCTNFAYSLGGVDYPEESATADITITVDPAPPIDRSAIPPVTVTINPYDNYVEEIPGVGYGQVTVEITSENAEECDFYASGDAPGWWGIDWGGIDVTDEITTVNLDVGTTTLYAECSRPYDTTYYSPGDPEYESGIETAQVDIVILPTTSAALQPEVYVYGNAQYHNARDIWESSTVETGFCRNSGYTDPNNVDASLRSPNCNGGNVTDVVSNAVVTFPFVSPDKQSDSYDLTVKYCDENDGFNDFTLTTESGFSASWRSDAPGQYHTWCHNDNEVTRVIGTDIPLEDGELITVECNNSNDPLKDEQCIFMGFAVGQGNGDSLNYSVSSSTGFAEVPIFWAGDNTVECWDPIARTTDGTEYAFETVYEPKDYFLTVDLTETTNLSVSCKNIVDDVDVGSIDIIVDSVGEITATTSIDVFECYDPSIPGVRNTNPGEWANPDNSNFCEAAVDLNAVSPSISFGDAITDNVAGLYDSLEALIVIENLGPGPLENTNEIEFLSRLELQADVATEFGLTNPIETVSTPGFTDGLSAPPDSSNPTATPVLTRTFDGIPFGEHTLCSRVNVDGSNDLIFTEWNADTTNNATCTTINLPVPPPPISIEADRTLIRKGGIVDITWTAHTSYQLDCQVQGPGGISALPEAIFDASENDPGVVSYVTDTRELESTSKFRITCTEPITGTTFIEEIDVEVVPGQQEV